MEFLGRAYLHRYTNAGNTPEDRRGVVSHVLMLGSFVNIKLVGYQPSVH